MIDIKWDDKFSVGHERIDQEHKIFLGLIKAVSIAADEAIPKEKILRILVEIKKYADFHFYSEENLMIDSGYPDYEEHKKEHQLLLARFDGQLHDYRDDAIDLDELIGFIFQWFALHTTGIDKKLAVHIESRYKQKN